MNEPTNRELKIMLDNQEKTMLEKHEDIMCTLKTIEEKVTENVKQATATNGKVAQLQWWKNGFVWAMGALWTLIIVGVPLGYGILRYIVLNEIRVTVDNQFKNFKPVVEIND